MFAPPSLRSLPPSRLRLLVLATLAASNFPAAWAQGTTEAHPFELGTVTVTATRPQIGEIGSDQISSVIVQKEMRTFNRDNVTLVDLRAGPIRTVTATGIDTEQGDFDLDVIIYATGFDAMTGALSAIDVRGRGDLSLRDFWASAGPLSYLGLAVAGFTAVSAIGCLNAWVLISGEVPLSMARAGLIPARIGLLSKHGIAWQPVIAAGICASVLILSNLSRGTSGLYDFMMRLTSSTNLILYIGVCVVALRFRINKWLAGAALLFSLGTLWGSGLEVAAWSGLLLLTALPLHLYNVRTAGSS